MKELLHVMTNEKIPRDTRIIVVDPLWCPNEATANLIAAQVKETQDAMDGYEWHNVEGVRQCSLQHASQARCLGSKYFEESNAHLPMFGRHSKRDAENDSRPTKLLYILVQLLIEAQRNQRGEFLVASADYGPRGKCLPTNMHVYVLTVATAQKLLDNLDVITCEVEGLPEKDRSSFSEILLHLFIWHAEFKKIRVGYLQPSIGNRLHYAHTGGEPSIHMPVAYAHVRKEPWKHDSCGQPYPKRDAFGCMYFMLMTMDNSMQRLDDACYFNCDIKEEEVREWITFWDETKLVVDESYADEEKYELCIDGVYKEVTPRILYKKVAPWKATDNKYTGKAFVTAKRKRGERSSRQLTKYRKYTSCAAKAPY
jgi:hypothetical protein